MFQNIYKILYKSLVNSWNLFHILVWFQPLNHHKIIKTVHFIKLSKIKIKSM